MRYAYFNPVDGVVLQWMDTDTHNYVLPDAAMLYVCTDAEWDLNGADAMVKSGKLVSCAAPEQTASQATAERAAQVRITRDALIAATDYLFMPDYPITTSALTALRGYRQALRDIPQQVGFPQNVEWPAKPPLA